MEQDKDMGKDSEEWLRRVLQEVDSEPVSDQTLSALADRIIAHATAQPQEQAPQHTMLPQRDHLSDRLQHARQRRGQLKMFYASFGVCAASLVCGFIFGQQSLLPEVTTSDQGDLMLLIDTAQDSLLGAWTGDLS